LGLLGLHRITPFHTQWLLVDVLWATCAAVCIGVIAGATMAHIGWTLRAREPKHEILDDLAGLGLIAVVYGLSVAVNAWGFLAVFFAAVALRQTELKLARSIGIKPKELNADVDEPTQINPAPVVSVSAESLVFKEHLERLSELMLVLLLGGMLLAEFWNIRTIALALFLFFIARPVSVAIGLLGTPTTLRLRAIFGWFGVRGIGSIYYLMYAINAGMPEDMGRELIHFTLTVITLSILMHGTSVKPLMHRFWRKRPAHEKQINKST
jgi:NhaP-type Na+/H+ or K+/H+ antiporter